MASINEVQDEIISLYEEIEDWMDRYALLIETGGDLDPLPEADKVPEHIIEGCQSRVWIAAEMRDGAVYYRADSDTLLIKGLIALLLRIFNGQRPQDIVDADLYFIKEIGFEENLSPTRANGLASMLKQIKLYALAFTMQAAQ